MDVEISLLKFVATVTSPNLYIWSLWREAGEQFKGIESTSLFLSAHIDPLIFRTELMLAFWRRVAELGHFEQLDVQFDFGDGWDVPDCVVQELCRATLANGNLGDLALSDGQHRLKWGRHIPTLFQCLKDHKGLRTLKVTVNVAAFGPNFVHLRQLLSHNRKIAVTDLRGTVYSDGSSIEALYSLNRFYLGSAGLVTKPPSVRPTLTVTALVEGALNNFQRSALLLADHIDVFCELVRFRV